MDTKKIEKLNALMMDETFKMELKGMGTLEEIQNALATRDIEMTEEELQEIEKTCREYMVGMNEELSDDQMENVSGGFDPFTGLAIAGILILGGALLKAVCKTKTKKFASKTNKKSKRR